MAVSVAQLSISSVQDIKLVKRRAEELCSLSGIDNQEQSRFVAAIIEIASNALKHAGGGAVNFAVVGQGSRQYVRVIVSDSGGGIPNLKDILSSGDKPEQANVQGIAAAWKLVDVFSIETGIKGTVVSLCKEIRPPERQLTEETSSRWSSGFVDDPNVSMLDDMQKQNEILFQALEQIHEYKSDLEKQLGRIEELNKELEETNKGVMALYKELDDNREQLEDKNKLLEEQHHKLQLASKMKGEFLANMSHEIRTPMNGILGMAELLSKTSMTEQQRDYLCVIRDEGKALLAIINDILDYSRIEAGKLSIETLNFDLVRVVEGSGEILYTQAKQKGLALFTFVDTGIPRTLLGDAGRLRQILINLGGNAVKFSEYGEVAIKAKLKEKTDDKVVVEFSVKDTGIGMDAEQIKMLFQPFVQVDGSISRRFGGTGLGLSICKRLVELMGGSAMGVQSEPGKGSIFCFEIPFSIPAGVEAEFFAVPDLKGLRLLLVETEQRTAEVLSGYLQAWGMNAETTDGASAALGRLHEAAENRNSFDIVIIDASEPGMNGLELGRTILDDPQLKDNKLILITSMDSVEPIEEAMQIGFKAYLKKPVRQSHLLDCITSVMQPNAADLCAEGLVQITDTVVTTRPEAILVVEDHPINQKVAKYFLQDLGFEADIVDNGQKALEAINKRAYDLIFMDIQMPVMNGYDATNKIREREKTGERHVPIIAMTAHAMEGSREECLAAGMDDYMSKPFDPAQLQKVLAKWLARPTAIATNVVEHKPQEKFLPDSDEGGNGPIDSDSAISSKTVWSVVALKERFGSENLDQLLELFLTDTPKKIARIKKAVEDKDLPAFMQTVHSLKGVCGVMVAQAMRTTCVNLEAAGREKNWERMSELLAQLDCDFSNILDRCGDSK